MSITFDTLKFVEKLEAGGFTHPQAKAAAEAFAEATSQELATKPDILAIRADLRADLAETKADIMKWIIGALGVQTLAILGGLTALLKMAGH